MPPSALARFRYRHTEYFAVPMGDSGRWLALDAGWPETLYEYARVAKAVGVPLEAIGAVVVTHMHPDHAGLVSAFQARGVMCVAFEGQRDSVAAMERIIRREHTRYRPIDVAALVPMQVADSRAWLASLGIAGEIIATPGHSDDSVSFIADSGDTVIGDLPVASLVMPEDAITIASWRELVSRGARQIFPAHAAPHMLTDDLPFLVR
jgi:endoribonuclease LACTB2